MYRFDCGPPPSSIETEGSREVLRGGVDRNQNGTMFLTV